MTDLPLYVFLAGMSRTDVLLVLVLLAVLALPGRIARAHAAQARTEAHFRMLRGG